MGNKPKLYLILLVGLALLLTGLVTACGTTPNSTPPPSPPAEQYVVSSSISFSESQPQLRVSVQGPSKSLDLILSDPNKNTIETAHISKDDLLDGAEAVNINMCIYGETPKVGTYTIVVKDSLSDEIYYQDTITFSGADLSITSCFGIEFMNLGNEYSIYRMNVLVVNDGDLPAYVYDAAVYIDGEELVSLRHRFLMNSERVNPGESKEVMFFPSESRFSGGTHMLKVELFDSQGLQLASYNTQVTVQASIADTSILGSEIASSANQTDSPLSANATITIIMRTSPLPDE